MQIQLAVTVNYETGAVTMSFPHLLENITFTPEQAKALGEYIVIMSEQGKIFRDARGNVGRA